MNPAGFAEQAALAREQALLGDYGSAIVYYDGVISQINK